MPFSSKRRLVEAVELEAVAMPLVDERGAVDPLGQRSRRQLAGVAAETHRAAQFVDAEQIAQLVDHLVRRVLVDLGGIGAVEPADVAREFDGRPLEAVADAEERDAVLARVLGRLHHAARAARAESAGHQDAVRAVEQRRCRLRVPSASASTQFSRTLSAMGEAAVEHRLVEALVGVLVAGVLADDVNGELVGRVLDAIDELLPRRRCAPASAAGRAA